MDIVPERTSSAVQVSFTGLDGNPATPSTVVYSTYCRTTKTAIKTDVPVTPATSVTIVLDALDNAIQSVANRTELKVLTVKSTYGANDECNDEYAYTVKNLDGVP